MSARATISPKRAGSRSGPSLNRSRISWFDDGGFPFAIELEETAAEPQIDSGRDRGQFLEFREQVLGGGDRILDLVVDRCELGDLGWIGADRDEVLLDPALHSRDPVVLQSDDLFAQVGVAVTGERFLELLFAVELVAEIDRERVQFNDVVGHGDLLVNGLEHEERFGAVAFLGVKLGQHRRAPHRVRGLDFLAGQLFEGANRLVVFVLGFAGFRFEEKCLLAQLRIIFQGRHLRRRFPEIFAQQVRLRDRESDFAGARAFGEFRLIIFEGRDRFRVIAGVEPGGADRVKNRLELGRHFDARDQRLECSRGLGEIAGLKFRHRLTVRDHEVAIVLARCGRDRPGSAKRRRKDARAPNWGVHGRRI